LQFLAGKGISAMEHLPYSSDLSPTDFWLFPELKSVLKGRHFLRIEDKSSVKEFLCILFWILKTVLNYGQSTGNIVKNWMGTIDFEEISL
jgi:hypothetical protein